MKMKAIKQFSRRAQLSMEFVIFIALGLLIMVLFLYIVSEKESQLRDKRQLLLLKDLAYRIQSEIDTASVVEDGYSRNFTLPTSLDGLDYDVIITKGYLAVFSEKFDVYSSVLPISGSQINKGLNSNSIRKENGTICLNTPSCP